MVKILDASALMAYFEKEPGYEKVIDALTEASESGKSLLMTVVNWGEVYYVLARRYHLHKADELMRLASTFPIEWVVVDLNLAREAALMKVGKALSYPDSFAAALTKLRAGELMTTDKDFKRVEKDIKILWL